MAPIRPASSCSPTSGWVSCSSSPVTSSTRDCSGNASGGWRWSAWAMTAVLALGMRGVLATRSDSCDAFIPVSIALTTTALGTLLPILRDNGMLSGSFGKYIVAAGATGEFLPIIGGRHLPGHERQLAAALVAGDRGGGRGGSSRSLPRIIRNQRAKRILLARVSTRPPRRRLRWTVVLLLRPAGSSRNGSVSTSSWAPSWPASCFANGRPVTSSRSRRSWTPSGTASSSPCSSCRPVWRSTSARSRAAPLRLLVFFLLLLVFRGLPALLVYRRALPPVEAHPDGASSPRRRCRCWSRSPISAWTPGRCCRRTPRPWSAPACCRCWSSRPWPSRSADARAATHEDREGGRTQRGKFDISDISVGRRVAS